MKTENWLKDLFLRILGFLTGIAVVEAIGNGFDYIVYPIITLYFGKKLWLSFTVLFISALILNYVMVLGYDFLKRDIFMFESWKDFEEKMNSEEHKKWWEKIMLWAKRKSEWLLMAVLCVYDPFMLVIYCRKSGFDGFKKRDYVVLILGTCISCIVWSSVWSPIVLLR